MLGPERRVLNRGVAGEATEATVGDNLTLTWVCKECFTSFDVSGIARGCLHKKRIKEHSPSSLLNNQTRPGLDSASLADQDVVYNLKSHFMQCQDKAGHGRWGLGL